jgi:hypothetical protein
MLGLVGEVRGSAERDNNVVIAGMFSSRMFCRIPESRGQPAASIHITAVRLSTDYREKQQWRLDS